MDHDQQIDHGEHESVDREIVEEGRSEASISYHDLHVTTENIERTSIFDLPYGYRVSCCRVAGWTLDFTDDGCEWQQIAGEYHENWLQLDFAGLLICDSRGR